MTEVPGAGASSRKDSGAKGGEPWATRADRVSDSRGDTSKPSTRYKPAGIPTSVDGPFLPTKDPKPLFGAERIVDANNKMVAAGEATAGKVKDVSRDTAQKLARAAAERAKEAGAKTAEQAGKAKDKFGKGARYAVDDASKLADPKLWGEAAREAAASARARAGTAAEKTARAAVRANQKAERIVDQFGEEFRDNYRGTRQATAMVAVTAGITSATLYGLSSLYSNDAVAAEQEALDARTPDTAVHGPAVAGGDLQEGVDCSMLGISGTAPICELPDGTQLNGLVADSHTSDEVAFTMRGKTPDGRSLKGTSGNGKKSLRLGERLIVPLGDTTHGSNDSDGDGNPGIRTNMAAQIVRNTGEYGDPFRVKIVPYEG
jgi:hypothetical protein